MPRNYHEICIVLQEDGSEVSSISRPPHQPHHRASYETTASLMTLQGEALRREREERASQLHHFLRSRMLVVAVEWNQKPRID